MNPGGVEPRRNPDITYINRSVTTTPAAPPRTAPTPAAAATLTGFGFVHLERTALKVLAIERLHGARRIRVRHFDESEPARATRITASDEARRLDGAIRSKHPQNPAFLAGEAGAGQSKKERKNTSRPPPFISPPGRA